MLSKRQRAVKLPSTFRMTRRKAVGVDAAVRLTMLPEAVIEPLKLHLARVKILHDRDLAAGFGDVELPDALARKYPRAAYDWTWKFVFPAHGYSTDPRSGVIRRHHVYEDVLIPSVKQAARAAGIAKHVGCHSLRHYAEVRTMPSETGCGLEGASESAARARHRFVQPTVP